MPSSKQKLQHKFQVTERVNVPTGRNGKHKSIVTDLLRSLEGLDTGHTLKIPLADLPDTKVNIRSALNRATRKLGKSVSTAADNEFLYVWNS
jgi:hypothetical protein